MKEIGRGGEYSPEEIEELLSEGFSKKLWFLHKSCGLYKLVYLKN